MNEAAKALFNLSGKAAVVTGASSGIGREIALAVASAGAAVVLVARRPARLQETQQAIHRDGGRAAIVCCDLLDAAALAKIADRCGIPFGSPDILVSAAGINPRKPIDQVTQSDWDITLRLNLGVPFFLAQGLVPAMIEKGWGRIINIASLQCVRALPNGAPYGASKGGLMQLTRAQAEAWSRYGINVNAIAPGFFPTELTASIMQDRERWDAYAAKTLVGRNGEMRDLHGAAIFLASAASDYITGQTLFVDGGWSAG